MNQFTNNRIVQIDFDASTSEDLSGDCKQLMFTSTEACYIRINQATVTVANGFYIPADTSIVIPITQADSISAIKETTGGKLTIMELF